MSSQCTGCGSAIEGGTLKCRRCGTEVPRDSSERVVIKTTALLADAGQKLGQGAGILGFLIHASVVLCCVIPFLILFPLVCAFGLSDVPARRHARACLWFVLDCYIGYLAALCVGLLLLIACIGGAALGGVVHFSTYSSAVMRGAAVGGFLGYISAILMIVIVVRCVKNVFVAAGVARDGGWHTYPVLFVSRNRTEQS